MFCYDLYDYNWILTLKYLFVLVIIDIRLHSSLSSNQNLEFFKLSISILPIDQIFSAR